MLRKLRQISHQVKRFARARDDHDMAGAMASIDNDPRLGLTGVNDFLQHLIGLIDIGDWPQPHAVKQLIADLDGCHANGAED
ncbi:MAG TPA: hypothetical protein VF920_04260 [Dongiaceae bacterium]